MVTKGLVSPGGQIKDNNCDPMHFSVGKHYLFVNQDIETEKGDSLAANVTTFENNTNEQMTYTTPSFAYTNTNTVTSSSTQAINNGIESTEKIEVPGAGSASVKMLVHFNFSTTQSQTNTETINWSVPPQNIPVKAHHKIRVTWILNNMIAKGNATMRERYSGYLPYAAGEYWQDGYALGAAIDNVALYSDNYWNSYVKEARTKWHPVVPAEGQNMDTADYDGAIATFTAKYGTEMYLKVDDITNGNKNSKTLTYIPIKNIEQKVLK